MLIFFRLLSKHFIYSILRFQQEEKLVMNELLITIASGLVEDKASIRVDRDEPNEEGIVVYHLHVAPDDMGRVIGKQGKIAKSIRTVMRAAAGRINEKIMVEID